MMTPHERDEYFRQVREMVDAHPEVRRYLAAQNQYLQAKQKAITAAKTADALERMMEKARDEMPEQARKALC